MRTGLEQVENTNPNYSAVAFCNNSEKTLFSPGLFSPCFQPWFRAQKPRRASNPLTPFATIIDTNNTSRYTASPAHQTLSAACTRPHHEHTALTKSGRRQRLLSPQSAASCSLALGPVRPAPAANAPRWRRPSGRVPPRPLCLAAFSIDSRKRRSNFDQSGLSTAVPRTTAAQLHPRSIRAEASAP